MTSFMKGPQRKNSAQNIAEKLKKVWKKYCMQSEHISKWLTMETFESLVSAGTPQARLRDRWLGPLTRSVPAKCRATRAEKTGADSDRPNRRRLCLWDRPVVKGKFYYMTSQNWFRSLWNENFIKPKIICCRNSHDFRSFAT